MTIKTFFRIFSIILAINFMGQVICSNCTELVQIEIDIDGDSEKKEAEEEKQSENFDKTHFLASLESEKDKNLLVIHYDQWWVSPIVEKSSPPPDMG